MSSKKNRPRVFSSFGHLETITNRRNKSIAKAQYVIVRFLHRQRNRMALETITKLAISCNSVHGMLDPPFARNHHRTIHHAWAAGYALWCKRCNRRPTSTLATCRKQTTTVLWTIAAELAVVSISAIESNRGKSSS